MDATSVLAALKTIREADPVADLASTAFQAADLLEAELRAARNKVEY